MRHTEQRNDTAGHALCHTLLEHTPETLAERFASWDEPGFRAKQVLEWVYQRNVDDYERMTNLSKSLRKRLTEALKQEGMSRDVVRHVQVARKEAKLELEDRIVLSLGTESAELQAAVTACNDYIAAETLATKITNQPIESPAGTSDVKIAGQPLHIELHKA